MTLTQILSKLKSLMYSKTETDTLLGNKAASSHTHTKSEITDFPTIPSKVSQLTNDSGFITGVSWNNVSGKPSTFTPSSHTHTKNQITDFPSLATVATSGSYTDLSNKPTIPSNTNQLTNGAGYITSSGSCNYANSAGSAGSATTAGEVSTSVAAGSTKNLVYAAMSNNDQCRIMCGGDDNAGYLEIATSDDGNEPIYVRQYNNGTFGSIVRTLTLLDGNGNTQFPGTVTAPTFSGNLNGNCDYATSAGSCNYANSAGSSSVATRDSGGSWISGRDNAVVKQTRHSTGDGYSWNPAVSVKTKSGNWTIGTVGYDKLQFSYDTDEDYNTGNNKNIVVDLNPESGTIITSANIGSQSVNYANSAGTAGSVAWNNVSGRPTALSQFTNDSGFITSSGSCNYATNSGYTNWLRTSSHTDHLFHTEWDGSYFWTYVTAGDGGYRAVRVERSNSSGWADSAGGVAWGNVSDRPWALSQFTNDSGFITADYAIPRSGGAVISGTSIGRTNNTDNLGICGGRDRYDGASLVLYGTNSGNGGNLILHTSIGSVTKDMALYYDGGWTWNGTAVQITSDQRLKQQISKIDNALLDAWEDVEPVQFKYNDAVEQKGLKARLHTGYVVQQIDEACKSHNLDISAYGLYCHEEYPEETEEVEVEQADGTKIKERKVIREASEHYSLRYTETLVVECAFLRREVKHLSERLSKLEQPSTSEK